jgi:hypothetical protein
MTEDSAGYSAIGATGLWTEGGVAHDAIRTLSGATIAKTDLLVALPLNTTLNGEIISEQRKP